MSDNYLMLHWKKIFVPRIQHFLLRLHETFEMNDDEMNFVVKCSNALGNRNTLIIAEDLNRLDPLALPSCLDYVF